VKFDKHAQRLPSPGAALGKTAQAVVPGGLVALRDYDHTRVEQPFGAGDVVEGRVL
jgi:hypothetical protein